MKNQINFTKEGYEELKKEYDKVFATKKDAIKTLTRAREMGDLSENGFYKAAKARLFSIYGNLARLEKLIRIGKIAQKQRNGIVAVSSKVVVGDGEKTQTFYIVGKFEADPLAGKISEESPIGRNLIGKKSGDSIKVKTPSGDKTFKILKVE